MTIECGFMRLQAHKYTGPDLSRQLRLIKRRPLIVMSLFFAANAATFTAIILEQHFDPGVPLLEYVLFGGIGLVLIALLRCCLSVCPRCRKRFYIGSHALWNHPSNLQCRHCHLPLDPH